MNLVGLFKSLIGLLLKRNFLYLRIALGDDGNTVQYFVKRGLIRLTFLCILAVVNI